VTPVAGDSDPAPRQAEDAKRIGVTMGYEAMGRLHVWAARAWSRERGQGTVEYVGLILLVAVILAGVVKASGSFSDKGIADAVVHKLKAAIDGVGK
jgi:hypothetical protein